MCSMKGLRLSFHCATLRRKLTLTEPSYVDIKGSFLLVVHVVRPTAQEDKLPPCAENGGIVPKLSTVI